ncbi:sugar phosphate nucleotidyltransferase [Pinibacter soli]|uniref:Sugar phosphate nucleotidyltransferase n=1 Tax=Pinibacter soli TaxID=3044211 RepID=A0ABT6RF27_9BACT|nr:sugar phosphate nucleotidyltransferase [Pinibacter soli]MDI3321021.1 sugar phosphate nucleotidyltransferase [Pinibacter soli]
MEATLVVLAAGMASRYGSLKQIDKFGPAGESIIDYSIYDAIEAGFNTVVFVIREEFEAEFKEIFEPRFGNRINIRYAYQNLESFTGNHIIPATRTKPWGTGHAVLCTRNEVSGPFAMINADDFYGKDAFKKAYAFLTKEASDHLWANICYELPNTLSDHGSVSRGICEINTDGNITSVTERTKVFRQGNQIVCEEPEGLLPINEGAKASMNFWCFSESVFDSLSSMFDTFLSQHMNELKSEFYIPSVADEFIKQGTGQIKAVTTSEKWFGVTYKEDKPIVQDCINTLVESNCYPAALWPEKVFQQ